MDYGRLAAAGRDKSDARQKFMDQLIVGVDEYVSEVVTTDRASARAELERFGLRKVADLLNLPKTGAA